MVYIKNTAGRQDLYIPTPVPAGGATSVSLSLKNTTDGTERTIILNRHEVEGFIMRQNIILTAGKLYAGEWEYLYSYYLGGNKIIARGLAIVTDAEPEAPVQYETDNDCKQYGE